MSDSGTGSSGLRRELGTIQSYAALIGILVGAGIFRVTSDAYAETGPSVILGHVVLAFVIVATSIAYAVFLSTPLGRDPGGEYTHISKTFGSPTVSFIGAWLKLVSYTGATAFLADTFARYLCEVDLALGIALLDVEQHRRVLSLGSVVLFFLVHAVGVRWFARVQVVMCVLLGLSILVLVVPGLFAIRLENYQPFFSNGTGGFLASLPGLFFAYAGFEALGQAAGEVKDSTERLPRVFVRGVIATALIFLAMSIVSFGVVAGEELRTSDTPMATVASKYLPGFATGLVALGGVFAAATSLNATLLVPARLGLMLERDGLLPRVFGSIFPATGTPLIGLFSTAALAIILLLFDWIDVAVDIAVFALMSLYALHNLALLMVRRRNPELYASVRSTLSRRTQVVAAAMSFAALTAILGTLVVTDIGTITSGVAGRGMTSLELMAIWSVVGLAVYLANRWLARR